MKNINRKITFEEFTEKVRSELQQMYPDCRITTAIVTKSNDRQLTGITIRSSESNIAPNIYLDGFYEEYQDGMPLEAIFHCIQELYKEYRITGYVDVRSIQDFDAAKNIICYRLINADRNREFLQTLPYRLYHDLAIIYYIPMSTRHDNDGIITVQNSLMDCWKVDEATLYKYASKNTSRLFGACVQPMTDLLQELGCDEVREDIPMYVARNRSSSGGAAVMLYEDVLQEFADTHDDFYILPSSTYEVIFLPAYTVDPEREGLGDIVREVNGRAVLPEDQLSDHVYYYHADTGRMEICE